MSDPNHDLRRLQEALDAVRPERVAMFVPEIDGYAAALIVCPETVEPTEWLPGIWGGHGPFADAAGAKAVIAALMEYYDRTARQLKACPEEYAPVPQIDSGTGEPMWEMWIDGFERAMRLRPDGWEKIVLSGDGEALVSVYTIPAMNDIYYGRSQMTVSAGFQERHEPKPDNSSIVSRGPAGVNVALRGQSIARQPKRLPRHHLSRPSGT